jgi:UDPglucose 6-dehydrogenase
MQQRVLIDGRNFFDPDAARRAGFDYSGIGRCARPRSAPVPT